MSGSSIAITTTLVNDYPSSLFLVLKKRFSEESFTPASIIKEFGSILVKYGQEKDPLSQNLFQKGTKFLHYVKDNIKSFSDESFLVSLQKIEEIRKLLINPETLSKFKNPWFVEDAVVFDETTLLEYQTYALKFSNAKVNAVPHQFAREILKWLEYFSDPEKSMSQSSLQITHPSHVTLMQSEISRDFERYRSLQTTIEKSKQIAHLLFENLQLEMMNEMLEKSNASQFQQHNEDLDRLTESHLNTMGELGNGMKSLQKQLLSTREYVEETRHELGKQLGSANAELAACKVQLNRQQIAIQELTSDLCGAISEVGRLRKKLKKDCSIV